jgi:hypothetical protein
MCAASLSEAGVWGSAPVLGVSADYSSDPGLLALPDTAETHGALLVDAPTSYNGDAFKFSILPSFRLSDSPGFSSLDSDYAHLNARSEFDTERTALTATAGVARDSSLYHDYLLSGSTGVRRDTANVDLNWDRQLTERFDVDTDVNSMRVRYGAAETGGSVRSALTDYKYTSISPTLAWNESERGKVTLGASAGRYDSLDRTTESSNVNLQLGFSEQLSEIWTVNASVGYSHATNRIDTLEEGIILTQDGPAIVFFPVRMTSAQNGTIFSANVTRQTGLLLLTAVASRQLVPSGFAFLSRQETYELKANYAMSERWSFSANGRRLNYQQPANGGGDATLVITSLSASAAWRWTEHWTATLSCSRVMEHYGQPIIDVSATGVSLELSRQFNWNTFQ